MTDQTFQSYLHLVKRAAIHSQQFRHTTYSSRDLSDDAIEDIGFQLVGLFEELYEQHAVNTGEGTPPRKEKSTNPADGEGGRESSRPPPYR